jgi:hypothetical protein
LNREENPKEGTRGKEGPGVSLTTLFFIEKLRTNKPVKDTHDSFNVNGLKTTHTGNKNLQTTNTQSEFIIIALEIHRP